MAFAGIQATVDFYTQQQADLTNQLNDIMTDITLAARKSSTLAKQTSEKKEAIYDNADEDCSYKESGEYDEDLNKVQDEYELKLAQIQEWESALEVKKENLETQVQAITSYKESFQSALKSNVQSDFKYAQS